MSENIQGTSKKDLRDPYRVVGVSPLSKDGDIKKTYREKTKLYHPDLNPEAKLWAEEKMKELVEAYNMLSDAGKRKSYDMHPNLQYRRDRKKKKVTKVEKPKTFMDKLKDFFTLTPPKPPAGKGGKGKSKIIEPNPKEAEMAFGLGVSTCDNNGFIEQTIDYFKQATKYDPECFEAFYNLGIAYYRKGMWNESMIALRKALNINPEDEAIKYMLNILREDDFS